MTKEVEEPKSELAILGGAPVRPHSIETTVLTSAKARERVLELLESGKLSNYYHGQGLYGIAVNSGTSALHLAATAADIGPGDEVIVPALCFVAAANAVIQTGGIPIICDVEPESLTLDCESVQRLIGPRTKAILPVHFWGYPSNSERIQRICAEHGLAMIEDCAQAYGATVHKKKVGTYGDYATFALSVRKHIACGEGGVVLCRREQDRDKLRMLSNYGKGPDWDDYDMLGFSYRLAEIPSVIALDGLANLDGEIAARRQAAQLYLELVKNTDLRVVPEPDWGRSAYFKCPILLPDNMTDKRQEIVDAIAAENVSCRIPHRPLYNVPWLATYLKEKGVYRGVDECPVAARLHRRLIEIETGPHLPLSEARLSGAALMKVWNYFKR
jgi:perosamine synthetase